MEYDDISQRLSALRNVNMSLDREHEIESVLNEQIQSYRKKKIAHFRKFKWGWIGSMSAAVVLMIVAIGIIANTGRVGQYRDPNTASHQTSTVVIPYTASQLEQVKSISNNIGVHAWIPKRGLPGDTLTIVKDGKTQLILDYKNFWVSESTSPLANSYEITEQKTVYVGGETGVYIVTPGNTFLKFSKGNTYIMIRSLKPGQQISLSRLEAIGASFEAVH